MHQHIQPRCDGRSRPGGTKGTSEGPDPQTVGQDFVRPGLQGRHRVPRRGRPDRRPRGARLLPRRIRVHYMHRQLGATAGRDKCCSPRRQSGGDFGAFGQSKFRGANQPGRPRQLPRITPAGSGIRDSRHGGYRPDFRTAGDRSGWQRRLPTRHLAYPGRNQRDRRLERLQRAVQSPVRKRVRRRRRVEVDRHCRGWPLRLERGKHIHPGAAVLQGPGSGAGTDRSNRRGAGAAQVGRLGDH